MAPKNYNPFDQDHTQNDSPERYESPLLDKKPGLFTRLLSAWQNRTDPALEKFSHSNQAQVETPQSGLPDQSAFEDSRSLPDIVTLDQQSRTPVKPASNHLSQRETPDQPVPDKTVKAVASDKPVTLDKPDISDEEVRFDKSFLSDKAVKSDKPVKPQRCKKLKTNEAPPQKRRRVRKQAKQKVRRKTSGRKKNRRLMKWAGGSLAIVLLVLVAGFALFHIRLGQSPMQLQAFAPYLEESINAQLKGLRVKLGNVIVKRSAMAIIVRVRDLEIFLGEKKSIARAPEAAVSISGPDLFKGKIVPTSLQLIKPKILVNHDPLNGFSLERFEGRKNLNREIILSRANDTRPANSAVSPAMELTEEMLTKLAEKSGVLMQKNSDRLGQGLARLFDLIKASRQETASLKSVSIRDGEVFLRHSGRVTSWVVPEFSLAMTHENNNSLFAGKLKLEALARHHSLIDFQASVKQERQVFKLNIDHFNPSVLLRKIGEEGILGVVNIPIGAAVDIQVSRDARIKDAKAILKLSPGEILVPGSQIPVVNIKHSTLRVEYESKEYETIKFMPSVIRWDKNEAVLKGKFSPIASKSGWMTGAYSVSVDNILLGATDPGTVPVNAGKWEARGTYDLLTHHIHIDKLLYRAEETGILLVGDIFQIDKIPEIQLTGQVEQLSLTLVKRFWSPKYGKEAREWMLKNLFRGQIHQGNFDLHLDDRAYKVYSRTGFFPDNSLLMDVEVLGIALKYMDEVPLIFSPQGRLRLSGRSLQYSTHAAFSELPSGRRVKVKNTVFKIRNFKAKNPKGVLRFSLDTTSGSMVELMQTKGFSLIDPKMIKPENLGGKSRGTFEIIVPLLGEVDFDKLDIQGKMMLERISSKRAVGNFDITGGKLNLKVSNKQIYSTGTVYVNKVPANVNWQVIPRLPLEKQPPLHVTSYLTPERQRILGLKLKDHIDGDIPVSMTVINRKAPLKPRVQIVASLDKAHMKLKKLFWEKQVGAPASVRFDFVKQEQEKTILEKLVLKADGLDIIGTLSLDRKNRLSAFGFKRIRLGRDTLFSAHGELRKNDNVLNVSVEGTRFDARKWLREFVLLRSPAQSNNQSSDKESYYGIDLKAQIKQVLGHYNVKIKGAYLALKIRQKRMVSNIAKGWFGDGQPLAVNMVVGQNNQRFLVAQTTNAGQALRFSGLYDKVEKGSATFKVALDPDLGKTDRKGVLIMSRFALVGEQAVKDVMRNSSEQPDSQNGKNDPEKMRRIQTRLEFDNLKAAFASRNGSFSLKEAYVNGPLLGATLRGSIDIAKHELDLAGTYVPLYGLNATLGAVPILGDILVGRKGEGMFGITFGIRGSTLNPEVIVNPVSLITPGIFRQMMEFATKEDLKELQKKSKPAKEYMPE